MKGKLNFHQQWLVRRRKAVRPIMLLPTIAGFLSIALAVAFPQFFLFPHIENQVDTETEIIVYVPSQHVEWYRGHLQDALIKDLSTMHGDSIVLMPYNDVEKMEGFVVRYFGEGTDRYKKARRIYTSVKSILLNELSQGTINPNSVVPGKLLRASGSEARSANGDPQPAGQVFEIWLGSSLVAPADPFNATV